MNSEVAVLGFDLHDKLEDFLAIRLSEIRKGVLFEFGELAGLAELTLKQLFKPTVHTVLILSHRIIFEATFSTGRG